MNHLVEVKAHFRQPPFAAVKAKTTQALKWSPEVLAAREKRLQVTFDALIVAQLASELAKADFSEVQQ